MCLQENYVIWIVWLFLMISQTRKEYNMVSIWQSFPLSPIFRSLSSSVSPSLIVVAPRFCLLLILPLIRVMAAPHGTSTTALWVNVGYPVSLDGSGHSVTVAISWDHVPALRVMGIWLLYVFGRYIPLVGVRLWLAHVCKRLFNRAPLVLLSWGDSLRGGRRWHGRADAFNYLTIFIFIYQIVC